MSSLTSKNHNSVSKDVSKSNTCSYESETLCPMPLKPLRAILLKSHKSCLPSSTWSTHCEKNKSVAHWPLVCAYFSCSWNFLDQVDCLPHSDCQTAIHCLTFSSDGISDCAKGCRYESEQVWDEPCSSGSEDTASTVSNVVLHAVPSFSAVCFLYNKINLQTYLGAGTYLVALFLWAWINSYWWTRQIISANIPSSTKSCLFPLLFSYSENRSLIRCKWIHGRCFIPRFW